MEREFLDFSAKKLEQLAGHIELCLDRLNDEQVWARGSENENAIGNLVLHLCGNVRQWIVSGVGARPDMRDRDAEFDARSGVSIGELREKLRGVIADAAAVLGAVTPERMAQVIVVQNYRVSVMEAIYHVVEHFA